jgi:hypothetical protein
VPRRGRSAADASGLAPTEGAKDLVTRTEDSEQGPRCQWHGRLCRSGSRGPRRPLRGATQRVGARRSAWGVGSAHAARSLAHAGGSVRATARGTSLVRGAAVAGADGAEPAPRWAGRAARVRATCHSRLPGESVGALKGRRNGNRGQNELSPAIYSKADAMMAHLRVSEAWGCPTLSTHVGKPLRSKATVASELRLIFVHRGQCSLCLLLGLRLHITRIQTRFRWWKG